jgi:hypothetical protein
MSVTVKRLNYPPTPTAGTGGTASKYTKSFLASDWTLVGSDYEITVLATDHQKGTTPKATIYLDNTTYIEQVEVSITINLSGDLTISVSSSPDNRFNGKLIII